jgi:SpoVK/Ycf46/Vps4 family AAA+-type ATPase/intein/homing endonuclease
MTTSRAAELEVLIRAKYPLIYVLSWEERRVQAMLGDIAARRKKRLFTWTVTDGIVAIDTVRPTPVDPNATSPLSALEYIEHSRNAAIFVLKDLHLFLQDARMLDTIVLIRKLRDMVQPLKESAKTVVLLSPVLRYPVELEKDITVLDCSLPTREELADALDRIMRSVRERGDLRIELDDASRERVLKAAQGLTASEAENVFAKSLVETRRLDLDVIIAEKKQLIRKSQVLEYYDAVEDMAYVGGMAELKAWLRKRGLAFTERARRFGLPEPRGLLLLGVQGGGKSLVSKSVAGLWKLPLLRLDMGKVFSEMVGSSEQNIRVALHLAESVAPCVAGESRIVLADGSERTIQDLYQDPGLDELSVLGMDEHLKIVSVSVSAITRRPAPDLYEIQLMHGRLRATSNHLHPVLQDGKIVWRRTDELTPQDCVAVSGKLAEPLRVPRTVDFLPADTRMYHECALEYAKPEANTPQRRYSARRSGLAFVRVEELKDKDEYPAFSAVRYFARGHGGTSDSLLPKLPGQVNDQVGYLLGLISSDGYLGHKGRIGFVNTELDLHRIFADIVQSQFGLQARMRKMAKQSESALPGTSPESVFSPVYASYVNNGLLCQILGRMQRALLSMPSPLVAAWLRGYFDGDGYVSAEGADPKIVLTSKVPRVNVLVRSALRRLGLRPSNPQSANIEITGSAATKRFATEIGSCHPEKKRRLDTLNGRTQWESSRADFVPVGQLLWEARQEIGMPSNRFALTYPSRISCYERNVNLPSRTRLRRILDEMMAWARERQISSPALDRLEELVSSPIGWSKVRSVRAVDKPRYVYDFVCNGNHTFIANGVITHNCVLWLDELEKGIAGLGSSNRSDAGTAARVFGSFLVWMQEKTAPVFVIATSNDISSLPPELLRKGRFDEIFFVDLPDEQERREILSIHLARRHRDPMRFDLGSLARDSEGFSGAEIEQVIISALYDAFEADQELTDADLRHNIRETIPLSQTMKEQITALRNWARTHARSASTAVSATVPWMASLSGGGRS